MRELNPDARLLIVDDNVANTSLLRNILQRLGFNQVEAITDSRETFRCVAEFQPDLIILDYSMPYLDGLGVMQRLGREIPRDTFLPVLMLTADATEATKRKALLAGATDLVTKPFNSEELFMRIRNLLHIRFLHTQVQAQNQTLEAKVQERTRELRAAQQQVIAQERLRAFGEMAGGIVHDFNNALMSVIGYSEMLLSDEAMLQDLKTTRDFLQIMNTAGHDASHVISRLRDFYRPREMTDVFSRVDLNELLEQAVSLTQPKWKGQALADGRTIAMELDLAKIPAISANAAELREVATNLIFNAVDAMPAGGTLTIKSGAEQGRVYFEVTDTGVGMTEEIRCRCLEPFFSTKGEKGTGLGLSMVFGIIKRHEGNVEIESSPGVGTTFRICLPLVAETAGLVQEEVGRLDRSLHVLVVDDEPVTRKVLQSYLAADGHRVVTAVDAEEALGCFALDQFDLVITDHAMPRMNGVQLAASLQAKRSDQAIIMVTGFAAGSLGSDEESAGFRLVMRKPVPRGELRRALATAVGSCQANLIASS